MACRTRTRPLAGRAEAPELIAFTLDKQNGADCEVRAVCTLRQLLKRKLLSCQPGRLLGAKLGVFFLKLVNASSRIDQLLFAGEKRMAVRTNFNTDVAFVRRACLKSMLTRADHIYVVIGGMNSSFHIVTFQGNFMVPQARYTPQSGSENRNPRGPEVGVPPRGCLSV